MIESEDASIILEYLIECLEGSWVYEPTPIIIRKNQWKFSPKVKVDEVSCYICWHLKTQKIVVQVIGLQEWPHFIKLSPFEDFSDELRHFLEEALAMIRSSNHSYVYEYA